jgi:hypothetical protein
MTNTKTKTSPAKAIAAVVIAVILAFTLVCLLTGNINRHADAGVAGRRAAPAVHAAVTGHRLILLFSFLFSFLFAKNADAGASAFFIVRTCKDGAKNTTNSELFFRKNPVFVTLS